MTRIAITGVRELRVKLARLPETVCAKVREAVVEGQHRCAEKIRGLLDGDLLKSRSGRLRRSIVSNPVEGQRDAVAATVSTNAIYARIQDQGGTITASNVTQLTIPLNGIAPIQGEAPYSAREVIGNPSLGGVQGTFFRKGLLFGRDGRTLVPLFALKSSITLPGHFWIEAGLDLERDMIERRLQMAVSAAVAAE
jgi:phage gpG-like protein